MNQRVDSQSQYIESEPILMVPEYDPVLEEAVSLLKGTSYEPSHDQAAVERIARSVRLDVHRKSFGYWMPLLVALVATAIFISGLVEGLHSRQSSVQPTSYKTSVVPESFDDVSTPAR